MNSIHNPRRRPRVSSRSWKVFHWVLVREVLWRLADYERNPELWGDGRSAIASLTTWQVRSTVNTYLKRRPERRVLDRFTPAEYRTVSTKGGL